MGRAWSKAEGAMINSMVFVTLALDLVITIANADEAVAVSRRESSRSFLTGFERHSDIHRLLRVGDGRVRCRTD